MIGDSHAQHFSFVVEKGLENTNYKYGYLDDTLFIQVYGE